MERTHVCCHRFERGPRVRARRHLPMRGVVVACATQFSGHPAPRPPRTHQPSGWARMPAPVGQGTAILTVARVRRVGGEVSKSPPGGGRSLEDKPGTGVANPLAARSRNGGNSHHPPPSPGVEGASRSTRVSAIPMDGDPSSAEGQPGQPRDGLVRDSPFKLFPRLPIESRNVQTRCRTFGLPSVSAVASQTFRDTRSRTVLRETTRHEWTAYQT